MDFFQAQEFFNSLYPDSKIEFSFDEACHRFHQIVYTDGVPNLVHHIECDKLKVTVAGKDPIYVSITPHRLNCTWAGMKELINKKEDVYLSKNEIEEIKALKDRDSEEYAKCIKQLSEFAALPVESIEEKIR